MLNYLLKLTLIWAVFLLVYEILYANNKNFKANRMLLIMSMIMGFVLPLVPIHIYNNTNIVTTINHTFQQINDATISNTLPSNTQQVKYNFNWERMLIWIYAIGAMLLLILMIKEIITILRKAIYGHYQTIQGHKVFTSQKVHAPFSFMGWVFIAANHHYSKEQLNFILQHEAAHNRHLHWLDLLLMQLITIAFWFHPLAWRYKRNLRIVHEYEADNCITESYEYGQFLLQETLLSGTPTISHSFHYSPIKKRITMLTKNQKRNSGLNYLLLIPIISACLICMSTTTSMSTENKESHNNLDCAT